MMALRYGKVFWLLALGCVAAEFPKSLFLGCGTDILEAPTPGSDTITQKVPLGVRLEP